MILQLYNGSVHTTFYILKCIVYFLYRLNIFYANSRYILFAQLNFIPSKVIDPVNNSGSK